MRHVAAAIALALVLPAMTPAPASAQPAPDFLFSRPNGMVGFRSGWLFASARSDLFDFVRRELTIDRNDFNAPAIGVDVEFALTPRVAIVTGFEFSQTSMNSEYRDFVDNQRLPIAQTTRLRELNLAGSVKFALTPRGREISSRAFIPAIATPYLGAGGGALRYQFLQFGDFIDVNTANLEIFTDTLRSEGWTPSAHVFGGVDVKVWRRMYVSGELRYLWANAAPGVDFRPCGNVPSADCFESIDLAGTKATVGVHYMF